MLGIFGIHFNITVFPQTIDPLIENEASDYADNLYYWVYVVNQTISEGASLTASSYIYTNVD